MILSSKPANRRRYLPISTGSKLYRFLIDLFFRRSRSEVSKPLSFDIVTAVPSLRLLLLIVLAVAAITSEGHGLKSLFADFEPASLAHTVVRFVHSSKRVIYFDDSISFALRENHVHVLFEFFRGKVAAIQRAAIAS